MAIIVDNDTRLVVQGLTGSEGRFHGLRNRAYGTNLVAGVTPGKGGQDVEGVPVFHTVAESVSEQGANTAMIFVPSVGGISHNPKEHTAPEHVDLGANLLLRTLQLLANQ